MNFSYNSISSKYEIKWKIKNNIFQIDIVIPNGCEALITLPNGEQFNVKDGKYNYKCQVDEKILAPDIDMKKPCNI